MSTVLVLNYGSTTGVTGGDDRVVTFEGNGSVT